MAYVHRAIVLASVLATFLYSFFNRVHFNSLSLHIFVLDYLCIKLEFINDAVNC
jgi:hypothetical protein